MSKNRTTKELTDELEYLLLKNNRKSIKDFIKTFVYPNIYKKDYAFWPNAQIVYALSFWENGTNAIDNQIRLWAKRDFNVIHYDDALMAYVLIEKTARLSTLQEKKLIERIMNALSDYQGDIIPYRKNNPNYVYIDLLGMVPQFLIMCGVRNKNEEVINWGVKQYTEFINNATDKNTGLLYHAYDSANHKKMGIIGWGRAMGWLMTGLSESILLLRDEYSQQKKLLMQLYYRYLKIVLKYQRLDGGFSWQLQAMDGPLDSSATAMILQSIIINYDLIEIDVYEATKRMFKCLDDCYEDGKVGMCSAECGGVGVYPQIYGSYAWSVAPYAISNYFKHNMRRNHVKR